MYNNAIFDIDGTIFNTAPGIFRSLRFAYRKMNLPEPPDKALYGYIGPSLIYGFTEIAGLNEKDAKRAIEAYREEYVKGGLFDCTFYDGVLELLKELKAKGVSICVASSKPLPSVETLLGHFGIYELFDRVRAPDYGVVSNDKSENVAAAITGDKAIMVGDRKFDVEAAQKNKIDSIGVTYGFAPPGELALCKPTYSAASAAEIKAIILEK